MTMAKQSTSATVPRLRFPEFRKAAAWKEEKLEELIETVSPPAKLPSSSYLRTGKFPIIDQSQDAICGWTDDAQAVIEQPLPLIVFGDHTCALKFVERPFAQGADGIKILAAKPAVSIEYLFHSLNHRPLVMEDYKRHFSTLKERIVFFPEVKSGEQQKIADCLTSLDEVIAAQGRKVEALKTHKRGLMQQLFPREGETRPRLRFPEFRDAPEWNKEKLGDLTSIVRGGSPRPIDSFLTSNVDGLNWLKIGDVDREAMYVTKTEEKVRPEALSKTRVIQPGDFILSNSMSFGRPYISTIKTCIHDGWIAVTCIPDSLNREFLYYSILSERSQAYFVDQAAGSGVQNLNKDIIKLLVLGLSKVEEQKRIADCLFSLDTQITAESHQLAALKTHKHGLMQQLFPALEAASA